MTIQKINYGLAPDDGTGDKLRDAFRKTDDNFTELDTRKANVQDVVDALAFKADTATVDSQLALKADTATVDSQLALKADTATVDSQLALKADTATVDSQLALKADTATVDSQLASKVDKVSGKSLVAESEITKLAGISEGATANSADSYLLDRVNHTGTQAINTVEGLNSALASKVEKTSDTGAAVLPEGTEAERPGSIPSSGLLIRLNKTTGTPEWYDRVNAEWAPIGSGSGGSGGELFDYSWHNGAREFIDGGRVATDGQQLSFLLYPDVCTAIWAGKQNSVTESVWQADPTKRNCWSQGDGSSWVRVPDLNAVAAGTGKPFYLRGGSDALNGTSVGDAIRNSTGKITSRPQISPAGAVLNGTGIFGNLIAKDPTNGVATITTQGSTQEFADSLPYDFSRVFPTADEIRVKTAYGVWTVRVATKVTNNSSIDVAGIATQLNVLETKVANLPSGSFKNKIINGKMEIAQRGTSFSISTVYSYTIDRWIPTGGGTDSVATWTQNSDVPSGNEFQSSLRVAITTADPSIASTQSIGVGQQIEGYNVRDLIGRTFTLSFWVRSSKTGTHCVAFRNSGADRSYVSEYTISSANTWEFKTVTVSGGLITDGTWNWTNGIGLRCSFTLAAGSNSLTTAGAWQTGNFAATANQVNCLDTVGNIFAITGVQLDAGEDASLFEHRPYGVEESLCQRYLYPLFRPGVNSDTIGYGGMYRTTVGHVLISGTRLRATPTIVGVPLTLVGAVNGGATPITAVELLSSGDVFLLTSPGSYTAQPAFLAKNAANNLPTFLSAEI